MEIDQLGGIFAARQMRNCMPCKKRKIKCDRRIPCGPCALRNDGKKCTPAVTKGDELGEEPETSMPHVSALDFQQLASQVQTLQERVRILEAGVDGRESSLAALGTAAAQAESIGKRSMSPPAPLGTARATSRRHVGEDEMVFALEDFQSGARINVLRNLSNSPQTPLGPMSAAFDLTRTPHQLSADHPLSFLIPADTDYLAKALQFLPDRATSDEIVQSYFDNVEWFQRCLHYPTFMRSSQRLWAEILTHKSPTSPGFVCTYLMVICLGLRTIHKSFPGISSPLALAERLYQVAQGTLWCSRFLQRHSFEALQAISLMTIYGYGTEDGADETWALCGSAVKIAQNLGLNRLEAEGPNKVWPSVWSSYLKREMGRRVWWTFVSLDWAHAMSHGSTYIVHPAQNLTALPANLDDDQLEDPEAVPRPLSVYTPISMHIFRLRFVKLYREITDHMASQPKPSYQFVLGMDDSVTALANSLPEHFGNPNQLPPDADRQLLIDSIFLNVTANIRLVRLHRPFFMRGYHDRRYSRSRERCVECALTVMRLVEVAKRRAPVLLDFWIMLFYAFSAAVPICIDLLFEPTERKRNAITQILETFRERVEVSAAARNSVFVLEKLLQVEANIRDQSASGSVPPAKRRRDSPDSSTRTPNELLRSTIGEILQTAASKGPPRLAPYNAVDSEQPTTQHLRVPNSDNDGGSGSFGNIANLQRTDVTPTGTTPDGEVLGLESMWPGFSFDMLDNLWMQTDSSGNAGWPLPDNTAWPPT